MDIYTGRTNDNILNGNLSSIRTAEYGRDARASMASAIQRCFEIAKIKTGGSHINPSLVTAAADRVRTEVYGNDVRDAFVTGITLSYQARGIDVSSSIQADLLEGIINAQLGEDLKNNILKSIVRCYWDVA